MTITVKVQFQGEELEDALVLPDKQTVTEFLNDYRTYMPNISATSELELYWVQLNGQKSIRLDANALLCNLRIQQGSTLELRERNPDITYRQPETVVEAPNGTLVMRPPARAVPSQSRLHCSVEISKSKRIRIPHSGLVIDRALITQHLSLAQRVYIQVRKMIGYDSPLDYVSRKPHCEVYLNIFTQQWEIKAYRTITIHAQVYEKGRLFQLPANSTVVQLGRAGMLISFHLNLE
jgi:hypothetical protein